MIIRLAKERRPPALQQRRRLLAVLAEAQRLIGLDRFPGLLQINLVSAKTMAAINEASLGHHGATDVLTYDWREPEQPAPIANRHNDDDDVNDNDDDDLPIAAEIYVCPDIACAVGPTYGNHPSREMVLYAVHGMLHLADYDDIEPKSQQKMRAAEDKVMTALQKKFILTDFLKL
ncbi:MAG: rRNA maturation RNase YbeY [Lentisphaerae bacterium]|jgi:probable rRNA maturation factor|nr:rRNA maturation RNase YbeY [Lentisphaerota bacterium]